MRTIVAMVAVGLVAMGMALLRPLDFARDYAGQAFGELTGEQKKQVEGLIAEFGNAEFKARQEAVEKLAGMGKDALPAVKETLEKTNDDEVRLRCRMVIERIEGKPGRAPEKTAGQFGIESGKVTLQMKDADAETALEELARQTGNRGPSVKGAEGKRVTVAGDGMSYWEGVEAVAAGAGLRERLDYVRKRVILEPEEGAGESRASAGSAWIVMRSRGEKDAPPRGAEDTRYYDLHYLWEDRLEISGAEVEVTRAVTEEGTELEGAKRKEQWNAQFPSGGTMGVCLNNRPKWLAHSVRVEGKVTLYQVRGEARGVAQDVFKKAEDAEKKEEKKEGLRIKVSAKEEPRSVWLVAQVFDGEGKPVILGSVGDQRYGFKLVDPQGEKRGPDVQLVGEWSVSEMGGHGWCGVDGGNCFNTRTLGFWDVVMPGEGWSLECVAPSESKPKEIPFVLKDVKIPPRPPK